MNSLFQHTVENIGHRTIFSEGPKGERDILRVSPRQAKVVASALALLTFVLDCSLPIDFNVAELYIIVVVLLAWTRSTRWLWGGAAVVAVLTVGVLADTNNVSGYKSIDVIDRTSRYFTFCIFFVLAGLIHARRSKPARRAGERPRLADTDSLHAARILMLGELAVTIAHELKQALAAISLNAQAALRWLDQPVPQVVEVRKTTAGVVVGALRAGEIIDRISGMAMRRPPDQTRVSLDQLIEEALDFLRPVIQSCRATVIHQPAADASNVLVDRIQLQQVIINLVVNSIQAMEQAATPERTITIVTTMPDVLNVRCTVQDSGPGIAPEHSGRIFERFFTTKENSLGIGLYICRSIIEAHGGRLAIETGFINGARFCLTLNAAEVIDK
jgi:C4-dicarboxylate-specific signal transduction histidine kinase